MIDIEIESHLWTSDFWNEETLSFFEKIKEKTFLHQDWTRLSCVSLLLTDDKHIQELNKTYRHKDKPTNVLSFSSYDEDLMSFLPKNEPIPLGDIVFSFETMLEESNKYNKNFNDHFAHLFVHGLLHLLGHDHEDPTEAQEMEQAEIEILKSFQISNPYEVIENI